MKLSLVPKELVDLHGAEIREKEDRRQLGIEPTSYIELKEILKDFTDLGLVEYEGVDYYASTYNPPVIIEDDDE